MRNILLLLLSLLWMNGCSIRPEARAPITYYYLQPEIELACTTSPIQKTVRLNFVDTMPSLLSQNIMYTKSGLIAGNYLYSKWHQPVNRSISTAFYTAFKENNVFNDLLYENTMIHSDRTLELKVLRFEHHFTDLNHSKAIIILDAVIYDSQTQELIKNRLFRSEVNADTSNAKGGTKALNMALGQLISEVICWSMQ